MEAMIIMLAATQFLLMVGFCVVYTRMTYMRGQMEQFMKAPVLRQYVEKNIPVMMTEEQKKELQSGMNEVQRQWQEAHDFMDLEQATQAKAKRQYPDRKELNPESLV